MHPFLDHKSNSCPFRANHECIKSFFGQNCASKQTCFPHLDPFNTLNLHISLQSFKSFDSHCNRSDLESMTKLLLQEVILFETFYCLLKQQNFSFTFKVFTNLPLVSLLDPVISKRAKYLSFTLQVPN